MARSDVFYGHEEAGLFLHESAKTAISGNVMMQHSWDAVLLGAVTLIAVVNSSLGDQKVTAAMAKTNMAVAHSDGRHTALAEEPASPTLFTGAR